eukprot:COSAG05_NODE_120_length_17734_cov_79.637823_13_plen_181_part_00
MSGFGAKVDMIPAHCSEVNRNQIWREHVGKEVKKFQPGGTFQLFSPKKVNVVVAKPPMAQRWQEQNLPPVSPRGASRSRGINGTMSPRSVAATPPMDESTAGFMATFKATQNRPTERYARPMTSSQSVGWDSWRPLSPRNPRFVANRRMCAETVYANTYTMMSGYGPYSSSARAKVITKA